MADRSTEAIAKGIRWAARVIGLVPAGIVVLFVVGELVGSLLDEGTQALAAPGGLAGGAVGLLGALALFGGIVSWWRLRLAGILLILAAGGFIVRSMVLFEPGNIGAWMPVWLPFLVAGGLFLIAERVSGKR